MAYQPVQRNAGEIMYNAAMRRAQTLGGALENWSNTLYQRQQQQEALAKAKAEEDKAFNSKLKALEALLQSHKDKFKLDENQLKQFLSTDPSESPKNRYGRIAGFVEGTMKAAELEKTQAEARKLGAGPGGQLMTLEDFQKLPPSLDAKAVPVPGQPGKVLVESYNLRAPASERLTAVDFGDRIEFTDASGKTVRVTPKGAPPQAGYETFMAGGQPAVGQPPTPTAPSVPASLSRFAPSAQSTVIGGPAALGQFMPAPAARPAVAPAVAPAAQPTPSSAPQRVMRAIPGSPQAKQEAEAAAARQAAYTRRIEAADVAMNSLDEVLARVSPLSVGVGSLLKAIPGTDAANIKSLLKNVQANTAFSELKDLKEDKTTLGQVAVREIELLQNAATPLDMEMDSDLFKKQARQLKARFEQTKRRLMMLEEERRQGRDTPSEAYYKAGGKSLEDLNKEATAATAGEDPTAALRAQGWTVKKK